MIKGLIFDFDGLMLDTETPEYQAVKQVYAEYGQRLPITLYGSVVGSEYGHAFEPIAHLESLTGQRVDTDSFWERVNRQRMEVINHSPALPGVENYLRAAKMRGLKLAVASSSPHAWVDGHLQRIGLFHYFDVIKCKDDVRNVKPNPELFLTALNALQLTAPEALVFEDSPNGVRAARSAGIRAIAVPNPVTETLKFEGESLRLRSLTELSLDELLARFDG